MNLYIDTNIYLSFYHLSSDDLEQLKKLIVLIDRGELKLLLSEQTISEFKRNRDNKISDALKRFSENKLNNLFPQFCKHYEEFDILSETVKQYDKVKEKLTNKILEDISKNNLKADFLISELFSKSQVFETTDEIYLKSKRRFEIGNPPGKNNSIGDAINWLTLIINIPSQEDLYFISEDKDYFSILNNDNFNSYLLEEWSEIKKSNLLFYKRLSTFFKENFPAISLKEEEEKELLINELKQVGSFMSARKTITSLYRYFANGGVFSNSQINEIVDASINNNQIYWISSDDDIHKMLSDITRGKSAIIEEANLKKFIELIKPV
jgi:predicted nucleic acid-binding protein